MDKTRRLLEQAKWIRPGTVSNNLDFNSYADFRLDFSLAGLKGAARFAITADQNYMLYVNGRYVGRGPARGFQDSWPYDEYDLRGHLRRGHNWISVRVHNGGCGTFQYIHQSDWGMLCAGDLCGVRISSSDRWTVRISRANRRDTAKLSLQLGLQESFDGRIDGQEWIRSARRPEGFDMRIYQRPFGAMPWHNVEARGMPNLGAELRSYRRQVSSGVGRAFAGYAAETNLSQPWFNEFKGVRWTVLDRPGAESVLIPAAGRGGLRAVVLDMGRPVVGNLIADVAGGRGGEALDFFFCEVVSKAGAPVHLDPSRGCLVSMSSRLVLARGRTRHEFFHMMGHRYLTVIARDTTSPLAVAVRLRETVYPLRVKGRFDCGDRVLNSIYRICLQTQRVCCLDAYVDTPWREQGQWWGDARVQARNTFHLCNDPRLLERGIRCIARQRTPNGLSYGLAPTIAHGCILPDFTLIWLLTLWDHYYQTGRADLFASQADNVRKLLGYFHSDGRSANGLLRYDPRYWLFLDWTNIYRQGNPALLNLWYALALEKTARLAGLAGMPRFQDALAREHRLHCRRIIEAFWDGKEELFADGLDEKGRRVAAHSIHTQTLAVMCALKQAHWKTMVRKRLLPYLCGNDIPDAKPSSYWVSYVYDVMNLLGYGAEVVEHLRDNFAPMVPYGGCWETFDLLSRNRFGGSSVSHAWAAHPLFHLVGTLGGIVQAGVAWKKIVFRPVIVPDIGYARAAVPAPRGMISSSWVADSQKAEVSLTLPAGVEADIILPGVREKMRGGARKWSVSLKR